MNRLAPSLRVLLAAAAQGSRCLAASPAAAAAKANSAARLLQGALAIEGRQLHTSLTTWAEGTSVGTPSYAPPAKYPNEEPARKYRDLSDKELWHEAWMYEDRFGDEHSPMVVPSVEEDRVIGVTDPEDDTVVIWGILREGDPPKQFIDGGEFYVLKRVDYIRRVGDVLEELEEQKAAAK